MRRGLAVDPGLCGACRHQRLLRSPRSVFLRCALADVDPRFPRYPSLPVSRCAGFAPAVAERDVAADEPPAGLPPTD